MFTIIILKVYGRCKSLCTLSVFLLCATLFRGLVQLNLSMLDFRGHCHEFLEVKLTVLLSREMSMTHILSPNDATMVFYRHVEYLVPRD